MNATGFEVLCDSNTDRVKWLEARRQGVGSSDVAGVLGIASVARWTSPIKVYTDKLMPVDDDEGTEAMKWGRILEPHIIEEFARDLGREAKPYGKLVRSRRWPWMLATCDATQAAAERKNGVLEVKATGWRTGDWDEGIPDHVRVQAQHQLAVMDWEWGSVAVLIRGMNLFYRDIERDESVIEHLVESTREFWERFQKGEPPNPDGSESARKAISALYPHDSGEVVQLPGELVALDKRREKVERALKKLKHHKEYLDQQFKVAIGEASEGVLADGTTYTYYRQERDGYTVKPTAFRQLRRKGG